MPLDADDTATLAALRAGDEAAFAALVDRHGPALLRVARSFTRDREVAEEVVQETWLAFLTSLGRFAGEASLRTWLFRILTHTALAGSRRERRSSPFSALAADDPEGPAVPAERFLPADHPRWPGHWAAPPSAWPTPEEGLATAELRAALLRALEALPPAQRVVAVLRDVEGWPADEVAAALELSPGNQRVLLHRARARLRAALEAELAPPV